MKTKKILLTLALILGAFGANAQEWRGFLEMYAGTSPQQTDIDFKNVTFRDVSNVLSFGLNYTMGIKVHPQIFAGVGIGGYATFLAYHFDFTEHMFNSLYFPVFVNARWIPDISNKVNPYVDLKIGYQMGVDLKENDMYAGYYSDNYTYYASHKNGLFLQPGVGIRFGRDSAFNFGIAYNVTTGREFKVVDNYYSDLPVINRVSKPCGSILLTFGADF